MLLQLKLIEIAIATADIEQEDPKEFFEYLCKNHLRRYEYPRMWVLEEDWIVDVVLNLLSPHV